ncbi:SMI1 / KNR4 family protein [Symmachiella dynata]|uniref:SMI1 / KNR4 family protein n=1 Tax=Symmachiella dynata TaxID=2527995 RepID=A0A517ZNY5_9PLAN|nr:SMI1/KNR4 family protein [Symmachiella dynata]QDU44189.1 SMI1 / KNR4 family protein [Symmachiella dynata]
MTEQSIATVYVDTAIESLRRHDLMCCPDPNMPAEMRDPNVPPSGAWLAWQPIASTVTDQDIDELESLYCGKLPDLYVEFLKYRHFYELTECGVCFESHVIGQWKEELTRLYDVCRQDFPTGSHLIPFGSHALSDAGPVCFDFQQRHTDGDCSIVIWDHEPLNTDQEIIPLFSSSAKMFESMTFSAKSEIDFLGGDPVEDSEEELIQKGQLLSQFLAIDPNGAGGPAREIWTCWGVTPQATK